MHFETMILLLFSAFGSSMARFLRCFSAGGVSISMHWRWHSLEEQQARISSGMPRGMTGSDSGRSIWRMG